MSRQRRMDPRICDVYLEEIATQCRFALNAAAHVTAALQELHELAPDAAPREQRRAHAEVFRTIHSFLTHASNVSRLLWPAPPRRRRKESDARYHERCSAVRRIARAAELRSVLNLPENDHPLRNRRLRDHLEHFDERLDHWEETSKSHNYAQDIIAPAGAIVGMEATDMMRWFDPSTGSFVFRGEAYDLRQFATSLRELLPVVLRSFSDPHRVQMMLREEFPDVLCSWEDVRHEVFSLVVEDQRLDVAQVKSIYFHPYGRAADVDCGGVRGVHQFSIELPIVQVPGPKTQAKSLADAIVEAIMSRQQPLQGDDS